MDLTIGSLTTTLTRQLQTAGLESSRLDVLILLEDVTGLTRAYILAHPEYRLTAAQHTQLAAAIKQRAQHTPLAYIRGKADFYGRSFAVDKHVLVPRPETEDLVELAIKAAVSIKNPIIGELGTGSGCIAISMQLEAPEATVYAFDIDERAISVAAQNNQALDTHVHFAIQNLLNNDTCRYDIILANLPYVPIHYKINRAASYEPDIALYAGEDGLDLYKQMWLQLAARSDHPAAVIVESLPFQHPALSELAQAAGYKLHTTKGLIQQFVR